MVHDGYKMTELGEIPDDWNLTTLIKVTDVRDGTHDSPKYVSEGIPFITSKNLKNNCIDFTNINYISKDDHHKIQQRSKVDDGDILFAMIGTIGNPVIVKKEFDFSIKNIALIKFIDSSMVNRYVLYLLDSNVIKQQFERNAAGGVQEFISLGMIRNLKIPIPSLPEQQKIASILSSVDETIEETEALIEKYQHVKKGLMSDLLTKGIDEERNLRSEDTHEFKDSVLGRVPVEWDINKLGSMCNLINGYAFKPEDWKTYGLPIIRIQNLNGGTDYNYFEGEISDNYMVPPQTLLFSWSGNRGTSFGPYIWKGNTGLLNQHIFKVIPKNDVKSKWFYYSLDKVRERVEMIAHGGSGLVHIKRGEFIDYIIATPSTLEQERIAEILTSTDQRIEKEEAYRDKLLEIKKGLMQDLLTGKVRVTV